MHLPLLFTVLVGGEIVDLVGETGPVAKVVLLILLAFSVISWAIILSKWALLRRARVQSGRFRAGIPQGPAPAGHCRRCRAVSSQPAGCSF